MTQTLSRETTTGETSERTRPTTSHGFARSPPLIRAEAETMERERKLTPPRSPRPSRTSSSTWRSCPPISAEAA